MKSMTLCVCLLLLKSLQCEAKDRPSYCTTSGQQAQLSFMHRHVKCCLSVAKAVKL